MWVGFNTWARIERIPTTAMKAATVSDEKPMTWGRRSTAGEQVRARRDKHGQENTQTLCTLTKHKETFHLGAAFCSETKKEKWLLSSDLLISWSKFFLNSRAPFILSCLLSLQDWGQICSERQKAAGDTVCVHHLLAVKTARARKGTLNPALQAECPTRSTGLRRRCWHQLRSSGRWSILGKESTSLQFEARNNAPVRAVSWSFLAIQERTEEDKKIPLLGRRLHGLVLPVWDRGRNWSTGQLRGGRRERRWCRWGAPSNLGPPSAETGRKMSNTQLSMMKHNDNKR